MLVNQLQHEDNLANIRAQWALVVQGLLATGVAALLAPPDSLSEVAKAQSPLVWKVLTLAILGLATAAVAAVGVRAAEDHQRRLGEWWRRPP